MENLFTNVPVLETINIIINNIYHHSTLPPLKINSNTLLKILLLCTTQVIFYDPHGNIYIQLDEIAMGSGLGPVFSNFYMLALENKVLNTINKPNIYLRYADDIPLLNNSTNEIKTIQEIFQNNFSLNFTQEININNKIPFLGVLTDTNNNDRILNKSWQQHPTRHQLYGHLPPITKTIQVRRTRHAGHCWRSRDELIRDVLLWIPTHGRAKAGRPARTYIQQLCEDTGCCPEDLPRAMNDREEWRERVRDIRATSAI